MARMPPLIVAGPSCTVVQTVLQFSARRTASRVETTVKGVSCSFTVEVALLYRRGPLGSVACQPRSNTPMRNRLSGIGAQQLSRKVQYRQSQRTLEGEEKPKRSGSFVLPADNAVPSRGRLRDAAILLNTTDNGRSHAETLHCALQQRSSEISFVRCFSSWKSDCP